MNVAAVIDFHRHVDDRRRGRSCSIFMPRWQTGMTCGAIGVGAGSASRCDGCAHGRCFASWGHPDSGGGIVDQGVDQHEIAADAHTHASPGSQSTATAVT